MTNLSKSNWNLPADKKLALIADLCIYGAPLISGAIMGLPLSGELTAWLIFPLTLLVAVAQIIAKFSKEMNNDIPD